MNPLLHLHHQGYPRREWVRVGCELPYLRIWSLRPPVPVIAKARRKGLKLPKVSAK